ncbi:hypothetical protein [Pelosinus sp. UFO1]|nr:hypothetical protein [Pelosinus sp. UFO1]
MQLSAELVASKQQLTKSIDSFTNEEKIELMLASVIIKNIMGKMGQ